MKIPEFIRSKRQAAKLSLRELALRCDVNPAYLSRVERGLIDPSVSALERIAVALGTERDELLLLSGRLPASLQSLVEKEPSRATRALRSLAEMVVAEPTAVYGNSIRPLQSKTAIEDGFPFDVLSEVAELESWRKEVFRPVYHVHKWWAQRLGSVFRAAILGSAMPQGANIMDLFYQPTLLPSPVVFDPFMGSGTTVGEAHKLGCTVIGRDINPVAWRSVRTSLGPISKARLLEMYEHLEKAVGKRIGALYKSTDSIGREADALYFFWVKSLPCPKCAQDVELFSSYVFAQHAYPKQYPSVRVLCPRCRNTFQGLYGQEDATCPHCALRFKQYEGPVTRASAVCGKCSHEFQVAQTARAQGRPPMHRMYAKLVLTQSGEKEYLPVTTLDLAQYSKAATRLREVDPPLPRVDISDGFNTKQVLNYGYRRWDQMFNDRQLLALSMLATEIASLTASPERDALALLFSGVLEFNNMFTSFKGEGTGAVRHMFAHHVLKPERVPIEANVWGTPKSSGAFSTLFKSRLLRAIEYREAPFEIAVSREAKRKVAKKVYGVSPPMGGEILTEYPANGLTPGSIYLSCGDSSNTDIPSGVVDMVITDPPFFDNVHYSELADFFYVWQQLYFGGSKQQRLTTRTVGEVQDTDSRAFAEKLGRVFLECNRVLRVNGLLVFSYHHSREDGWLSVAHAVLSAGFTFVQAQPVKSEMAVAMPKMQAKEPIDLDVLIVCRKRESDSRAHVKREAAIKQARRITSGRVKRFNEYSRSLSRNDVLVMYLSQLLVELSPGRNEATCVEDFSKALGNSRVSVEELHEAQRPASTSRDQDLQAALFA